MTDINAAIQNAIVANLPAATAGEMKTYLEQAEKAFTEVTRLTDVNEYQKREIQSLKGQIAINMHNAEQLKEIAIKEKDLAKRELALTHANAKLVADVALAELKGVKESMGMFLKNTIVRSSVAETVGIPVEGYTGANGMSGSAGRVESTIQTRNESKEIE